MKSLFFPWRKTNVNPQHYVSLIINKQTKLHVPSIYIYFLFQVYNNFPTGLFITVKINTSNALQKKKCKQKLEQSLATTPGSNVYRHLNNQVLNNLEPDLIKTHLLVLTTRTTQAQRTHVSTKILPLFCNPQEVSPSLRFSCNLFPLSSLFHINSHSSSSTILKNARCILGNKLVGSDKAEMNCVTTGGSESLVSVIRTSRQSNKHTTQLS